MLEKNIDEVAAMLKSISHPLRLKILCFLQEGEKSVSEITEEVQTSTANISQHLSILRNQKIVSTRRDANFIYNRISDDRILELMGSIHHLFCAEEDPDPGHAPAGEKAVV